MRDLYRCLDEYSPPLLNAIAECWHVTLPGRDALEMVRALGDAMLLPGAVEAIVATLPPDALAALAETAQEGGAVPAQRLVLRYGALRRLGPARLSREQPWLNPQGATEQLYFRGLLFRAYGQVGDYLGDILIVPDQLLERLPALATRPPEWEQPLVSPTLAVRSAGPALVEDLFAALAHLRRHPAPSAGDARHPLGDISGAMSALARWRGEGDPGRLTLIWRLMVRLSLVSTRDSLTEPGTEVRGWLSLDDAGRHARAFAAWRDDPDAHELLSLPAIRCEATGSSSSAADARRHALAVLARFAAGEWYRLDALAIALKRHRPDYLRAEGEAGWFIRDAASVAYLEGPDAWDRVEAILATAFLVGPLYWLGALDLGVPEGGREATAFRLSEQARAAVNREPPVREARRVARPRGGGPVATCDEGLQVRISLADSQYERYQLERLARWLRHDDGADAYQITEESIWEGHERGIRVPQVIAFLRRLCGERFPPGALRTLQEWGAHLGRATLTRAVVLRVADEATMALVRTDGVAAAMLGETLSPLACTVAAGRVEALIARLKAMHIWPHLRLDG